jgi:hypothetical protein
VDVAASDGSDCLDPGQGGLCSLQGSEALPEPQKPLQGSRVTFDPIAPKLSVDMTDAVEMRIVLLIDLTNDGPIGVGFVGVDRDRPIQTSPFDCLAKNGSRSLRDVTSGGSRPSDRFHRSRTTGHAICPPDANVSFIGVPEYERPPQVLLGSLGQLGTKLLNPAIHGRSVDDYAALFQDIDDILARQRISQIPAHGTKDDLTWKAVILEGRFARHALPEEPQPPKELQLTHQSQKNRSWLERSPGDTKKVRRHRYPN